MEHALLFALAVGVWASLSTLIWAVLAGLVQVRARRRAEALLRQQGFTVRPGETRAEWQARLVAHRNEGAGRAASFRRG